MPYLSGDDASGSSRWKCRTTSSGSGAGLELSTVGWDVLGVRPATQHVSMPLPFPSQLDVVIGDFANPKAFSQTLSGEEKVPKLARGFHVPSHLQGEL